MSRRDPHHISRVVDIDRQMCGAGFIAHTAIDVVAEDRQQISGLFQIRKGALILRHEGVQVIPKFLVSCKGGDHGQHYGGAILAALSHGIGFHHLSVAVILAGQHGSVPRVIDRQVIGVRAGSRLVLGNTLAAADTHGARLGAILAGTVRQHSFHNSVAQRGLCAIPIGGRHLDFLPALIKWRRQGSVKYEQF